MGEGKESGHHPICRMEKKVASDIYELTSRPEGAELGSKIQEIEKKQAEKEALQQQLHESFIKYKVKKAVPKAEHETDRDRLKDSFETKENEIDEDVEELLGAF